MTRSLADELKGFGITNKAIGQFDIFTISDELIDFPQERLG